jgi:membrane protein YqaA with SNARE-associated domain
MSLPHIAVRITEALQARRGVRIALAVSIMAVTACSVWYGYSRMGVESIEAHGYAGVFLVNLVTCATIIVPIPGGAAFNVAAGTWMSPPVVTLVAACASTLGELTAYLAGSLGHRFLAAGHPARYAQAERLMRRLGAGAIFLFAFLPALVYDLVALVAGSIRYRLWKFIMATFIGRVLRHAVQVYLGYLLIGVMAA